MHYLGFLRESMGELEPDPDYLTLFPMVKNQSVFPSKEEQSIGEKKVELWFPAL